MSLNRVDVCAFGFNPPSLSGGSILWRQRGGFVGGSQRWNDGDVQFVPGDGLLHQQLIRVDSPSHLIIERIERQGAFRPPEKAVAVT